MICHRNLVCWLMQRTIHDAANNPSVTTGCLFDAKLKTENPSIQLWLAALANIPALVDACDSSTKIDLHKNIWSPVRNLDVKFSTGLPCPPTASHDSCLAVKERLHLQTIFVQARSHAPRSCRSADNKIMHTRDALAHSTHALILLSFRGASRARAREHNLSFMFA